MRDNKKTAVNLVPDYHELWAKRVFYSGSAIDCPFTIYGKHLHLLSRLKFHLRIVF
jgi:hypothetical protein